MKSVFALLADPIYYQVLPFGEARGHRTCRIRSSYQNYFEMLMMGQESNSTQNVKSIA